MTQEQTVIQREEKRAAETPAYAATMAALKQAEQELPDFSSSYDGEIGRLFEKIVQRPAFQYDPEGDPLFNSYRDRTVREGRLAMRDTMGQAAHLTGGYGSSYGQAVGQQQYDAYLQKLGDAMPELYGAALKKWQAEGEQLSSQFGAASALAERDYGRARDKAAMASQIEQKGYDRRQTAYKNLVEIISKSGYAPNSAELSAAGMSQAQADALRQEYLRVNGLLPSAGGGGGGGGIDYYWGGGSGSGGSSKSTGASAEQTKLAANARGSGSGSGKSRRT
jgi:hypothetical protein